MAWSCLLTYVLDVIVRLKLSAFCIPIYTFVCVLYQILYHNAQYLAQSTKSLDRRGRRASYDGDLMVRN